MNDGVWKLRRPASSNGVVTRDGAVVFQRGITTYDGLMGTMFDRIRQTAKGNPAVLIHMLDILTKVAQAAS